MNGEYFLTMEYVQGKTVSRFTRRLRDRKQQLPLGLILLLGERVCTGLQYAHDAKDEKGDPLHLVVEIKGYRGEDAKVKKETMQVYWLPGVNALGTHGRWAFAEFTEVYAMQDDFGQVMEAAFDQLVNNSIAPGGTT